MRRTVRQSVVDHASLQTYTKLKGMGHLRISHPWPGNSQKISLGGKVVSLPVFSVWPFINNVRVVQAFVLETVQC